MSEELPETELNRLSILSAQTPVWLKYLWTAIYKC